MRANNHQCNQTEQRRAAGGEQAEARAAKDTPQSINWNEWWPFTRATGAALRQLNQRQPKHNDLADYEEAPL